MPNIYNSSVVVLGGGAEISVDNGMIYEGKYRVRYFDIDGTILKIEYVAQGGNLTPPNNPTYDPEYLIFDEWNYDIENYIVEQPIDVGAIYRTKTGDTYLFIKLTENIGLTIPSLQINGATNIDWGDGTIDSNLTHTYTDYGEYIIKISGMTNNTSYLFGSATSAYPYCLKKCYLGNTVTSILKNAFNACYSLTSISIPNSVTNIGSSSFNGCFSLKSISIPNSVTSILSSTFSSCYSLINISIPNSVTSILKNAFYYCYSLTSISIPNSVTGIGDHMFSSCYSLTSVNISNNMTSISGSTFSSCYSLTDISIPNGITRILNSAFYYCYSLTSISIPNSVTTIEGGVFSYCYSIVNYILNCNSVPTLSDSGVFTNINKSAIIWVKDELVDAYKSAENWSTYANYIKPLSQYNAD